MSESLSEIVFKVPSRLKVETSGGDSTPDTRGDFSMPSEPKTNGCLVTSVCARWFCGYAHCENTCDWDLLFRSMSKSFVLNYQLLVLRVAPHLRKKAEKRIKEVYFGGNRVRGNREDGIQNPTQVHVGSSSPSGTERRS